jgi:DNA-binding transcriptional regulator YiaG
MEATAKKYRSDALAAIHETTEALHEVGAIDQQTMHEFDEACLISVRAPPPAVIARKAKTTKQSMSRCRRIASLRSR